MVYAASWKWSSIAILCVGALGCDPIRGTPQPGSDAVTPTSVLKIRSSLHRDLVENSAAVTSVRHPGLTYGINDSGHDPAVFVFDSLGRHVAVRLVSPAGNRDWEAAATGPCGTADSSCLYIGDVGDNDADRSFVLVYRIEEPDGQSEAPLIPRRLVVSYPDRAHDVEAMYVAPNGDLYLITKRPLRARSGALRPALVFRVPASAWDVPLPSGVVAALVDSLPIVPGSARGRTITDAALSHNGRWLAVRTYAEVYTFAVDSVSGLPRRDAKPSACSTASVGQKIGEGIGWWWDNDRLLLTGEGRGVDLAVIRCPKP